MFCCKMPLKFYSFTADTHSLHSRHIGFELSRVGNVQSSLKLGVSESNFVFFVPLAMDFRSYKYFNRFIAFIENRSTLYKSLHYFASANYLWSCLTLGVFLLQTLCLEQGCRDPF